MKNNLDYISDDEVPAMGTTSTVRCPECGRVCPSELDFCEECGAALDITIADDDADLDLNIENYEEYADEELYDDVEYSESGCPDPYADEEDFYEH